MESSRSNAKSYQDTSLNGLTALGKDEKSKEVQMNPEEMNGVSEGIRLTEEMLEYYHQKGKEMHSHKKKYEMAAFWVYGTTPDNVDSQKFRLKDERFAQGEKNSLILDVRRFAGRFDTLTTR